MAYNDFYSSTNTDITYNGTSGSDINDAVNGIIYQINIATPWLEGNIDIFKKRRMFLGRSNSKTAKAEFFFKVIKKGMKVSEWKKLKAEAEKAFEEAVKHSELGQDRVAKELEKIMEEKLKMAAIGIMGYTTYVDKEMIDSYRKHLPSDKELIIDDLEEYEKPLPKHAKTKLVKAKHAKVFDSFCIFWIREVKDPILFGQINEEVDKYYFIDEWDNDISIDDLLKFKK